MVYSQVEKVCKHCKGIFRVHNCRKEAALYCSVLCKAKEMSDVAREKRGVKLQTGEKECTQCKETKSFSDFYAMVDKGDGLDVWCKKCKIEANKKYHKAHAEERSRYYQEWKILNKERLKVKRQSDHSRTKEHDNHRTRESHLKRKYGLTLNEYNTLLVGQNNQCGICGSKIYGRSAKLDHCHKNGKIRGFLCNGCNLGLGAFKDSEVLLGLAIRYLNSTCYDIDLSCKAEHGK